MSFKSQKEATEKEHTSIRSHLGRPTAKKALNRKDHNESLPQRVAVSLSSILLLFSTITSKHLEGLFLHPGSFVIRCVHRLSCQTSSVPSVWMHYTLDNWVWCRGNFHNLSSWLLLCTMVSYVERKLRAGELCGDSSSWWWEVTEP